MNAYRILRERQQKEFNDFSSAKIFYAFNKAQFEEGLKKIGAQPGEKLVRLGDSGGFIKKSDEAELDALFTKQATELAAAIEGDRTGDGFIFDMFSYELANHEYSITGDLNETLEALGITAARIESTTALKAGLKKALRAISA